MDSIITSLTVSLIAISVIFTVLIVLIYTIKLLVYLLPYKEAPVSKSAEKRVASQNSPANAATPEIISAITAVMAKHLKKSPQEFHITQINPK